MNHHLFNKRGFTLIEVLVAVSIGLLVLSAIYVVISASQKSAAGLERRTAAQQDARSALALIEMEIGMASYNPLYRIDSTFWKDPSCVANSAHQEYRGIQEATPTRITIEMVTADGNTIGDDPDEIIRYNFDAANQKITRSSLCGNAEDLLGATTGGLFPKTVRVVNATVPVQNGMGNTAIFRYFDGAGNELYPDVTPANIPDIRKIDITLAVDTDSIDPMTNQRRRLIYTGSIIPKNHAMSP
ncbi:MAG TPA: prepilin-type N-terminal cleavage/methylation domain-containing protein [Dissulfurispiraceae bacterium]|nr:prepilin-type N-terminal cleavage/methylation domain-containing protein [Dissulfurispiraceae bacterium]